MPGRRAIDLSIYDPGQRQECTSLLEFGLSTLSTEKAMYDSRLSEGQTLGARSRHGGDGGPGGSQVRLYAHSGQYGGASLWHDQVLDGPRAFYDEASETCEHRDEPACAVLQPQTDVADIWCWATDSGDKVLNRPILRWKSAIQKRLYAMFSDEYCKAKYQPKQRDVAARRCHCSLSTIIHRLFDGKSCKLSFHTVCGVKGVQGAGVLHSKIPFDHLNFI